MGQTEIVVHMIQHQLLPQARFTLAQRAGTSSNGRDMLTQAAVDALYQRGVDLPAQRYQNLIDRLERAEHHPATDAH